VEFNRAVLAQLRLTQIRVDELETRANTAASDLEHHSSVLTRHEGFGLSALNVETRVELVQQQAFSRITESAGILQRELSDLAAEMHRQRSELSGELLAIANRSIADHDRSPEAHAPALERWTRPVEAMHVEDRRYLDGQLGLMSRSVAELRQRFGSLDLMLDGLRSELPSRSVKAIHPDPRMDSLYVALENAFRGSPEIIRERLLVYLDDLETAARGEGKPILDVGCGRGELLEMLKEHEVPAYGIEINSTYSDAWLAAGLDVKIADVADHLRGLPEKSLAGVTAIQVVEHLNTELLLEFFDLSLRALAPGGLLILETPNPANLIVGSNTFYLDPSHSNPIPADLLAFLVRARGFGDVEIRLLDRPEIQQLPGLDPTTEWAADLEPIRDVLRQFLFGPQDYAVVARRL